MTVGEYLTSAFKKNDEQNVSDFKNLIMDYDFEVVPISWDIAEEAARIRSKYTTFKMMDALQLAAAKIEGCDAQPHFEAFFFRPTLRLVWLGFSSFSFISDSKNSIVSSKVLLQMSSRILYRVKAGKPRITSRTDALADVIHKEADGRQRAVQKLYYAVAAG